MVELLSDARHTRSDLRLIQTAIKKGWNIPDHLMEDLPAIAGAMAQNGKPREQIAAMQVLLKMKEQNEKQEPQQPQQVQHTHTHELGPVTVDNLAERKRQLAERIARLSRKS